MAKKLFGTDGIRGRANTEPMTAETALKVAMASALELRRAGRMGKDLHRVLIGKDTRLSCYMIEQAMTAGFLSLGLDVILTGPVPTPAVAMLTRSLRADLGVMISASHNAFADNGIKLFGADGTKLSDALEMAIEGRMAEPFGPDLVPSERLGRAARLEDAKGRYVEYVKNTFPKGLRLDGLKVVVDCANGAAYRTAPQVLWELGAEVHPIGCAPDGTNINAGVGAVHPEAMQAAVREVGADLGIALDGDADRLILADETGAIVDGDQIMALIGRSWGQAGRLSGGGLVATVMSNLGLERFLGGIGVTLERAQVGDRYVVERMRDGGFNVGGEQSGHIVLSDYSTTGDGLIAALQVLAVLREQHEPASRVLRLFEPLPQLLRNVRLGPGVAADAPQVLAATRAAEARLGAGGRVLVRKSGTEPLLRVMVEGEDPALIEELAAAICAAAAPESAAA